MKHSLIILYFLIICLIPISLTDAETGNRMFKNELGMKFIYIPQGSFLMGSPSSEMGRDDDEKQHQVTISTGFYISSTEVTQGQWYRLMGYNPSHYKELGKNGPVEQVSWDDCQEFISKLNHMENTEKYRLPTEAEWEYACRAGSTTAFTNGEITGTTCEIIPHLDAVAWYCGNSGSKPHRVATKKPNAWGLYDMHGNSQEWVLDACKWRDMWTRRTGVITDTYKNNIIDPLSKVGAYRIFRGGSWNQSAKYSRSSDRGYFRPNTKRTYLSFRVVKQQ